MPVDSVGLYLISVEVQDPVGARGTAWMSAEGYDPITPFSWRVYAGGVGHMSSTDDGLIVADHGGKEYNTWVLCNCPLMAFDETGQMVWSIANDSASGAIPIPSVNGAVYFSDDTGTLRRISGSGAVQWSLDGAAQTSEASDELRVILLLSPYSEKVMRQKMKNRVIWYQNRLF